MIAPLLKQKEDIRRRDNMKICLVSDQLIGYHETWSGAEIICNHLAKLLLRENQDIVFITTRFTSLEITRQRKKSRAEESLTGFKKKNHPKNGSQVIFQIPTINIKPLFLKKAISPFFRILGIIYSLYYLRKEKPDIVHFFHSNYLFLPVMISAQILKIPTVLSVLDYFIICQRNNLRLDNGKICNKPEGWHCLGCISPLKLLERFIIRLLFKNLKGIITFTETSKSRLIEHSIPADKIRVIYTYNVSSEFAIGNERANKIIPNSILFVGTFFEYKGLDIVIRALPKIVAEVPDSRLMIVGIGYEIDKIRIEKIVKDLKLKDYIKFLGQRTNEEVLKLILKSEVVVVPEQWPSDFGPLILVEAMAGAKPIVASKIGAIPEFIKDGFNGFLVRHNQAEQFAAKIAWLLKNKSVAQLMGKRAKNSIQLFLKDDQGRKVLELYNNILPDPLV